MIVRRQYRGGYQVTGLVELSRELRKKQTSAEGLLWQLLRNRQLLEFKFRRQHQFGDYVADFYCPQGAVSHRVRRIRTRIKRAVVSRSKPGCVSNRAGLACITVHKRSDSE